MAEGAAFRSQATMIFWAISIGLIVSVIVLGWVGWKIRRGTGLAVGLGVGGILAFMIWAACGLLYAMSQDGG